jgi:hypothetical protein
MTLNQVSRVVFYPFSHDYMLDGEKILIGVTSLMKKHGLSPDYSHIDEGVLQHAAELGTQAHETIEAYCDGLPTPDIPLVKSFKKLGLNIVSTEYLVTDFETVASSIDLVSQVDENTVDLIDMKRTSSIHKDALSAQLGFYKVFFEAINPDIKVRKCFCLPIKKGNKDDILKDTCGKLVEIEPMSAEKVNAVLLAEKEGRVYHEDGEDANALEVANVVEGFMSVGFGDAITLLAELQAKAKEVETSIADAKEQIYQEMLSKGVDKVEVNGVSITLKKPYQQAKFDTSAFKRDHPDLAEGYTKMTDVKGNITIKIK